MAGDEALLRQLLANLVGNAIKYVPADRTPVVVVDAVAAPAGRTVLRVSDTATASRRRNGSGSSRCSSAAA